MGNWPGKRKSSKKVTRTIIGSEITRDREEGNKALLIMQEDGREVLKLESEVKNRLVFKFEN